MAALAHGVDLIDEDHAFARPARPLEQISDAARAHTHVFFHEIRTRQREEGHVGLAGQRPGQQRLARARRAVEQHAPGHPRAVSGVFFGIFQIIAELRKAFARLGVGRHVGKGALRPFARAHRAAPGLYRVRLCRLRPQNCAEQQPDHRRGNHALPQRRPQRRPGVRRQRQRRAAEGRRRRKRDQNREPTFHSTSPREWFHIYCNR